MKSTYEKSLAEIPAWITNDKWSPETTGWGWGAGAT
jgi:hypothetical protein